MGQYYVSGGVTTWTPATGWGKIASSNSQFFAMDQVSGGAGSYAATGTISDTSQTGFRFATGFASFKPGP